MGNSNLHTFVLVLAESDWRSLSKRSKRARRSIIVTRYGVMVSTGV
jgi:hypothetical protein